MSVSPSDGIGSHDEHWEIYVTLVNDNPSVVVVDLGFHEIAPIEVLPTLGWLALEMQAPDEDGFPTEDEDSKLNDIEDFVMDSLEGPKIRYVGRITSVGRRSLYFYMDEFGAFEQAVEIAMAAFPDYKFEIDQADDPRWDQYINVLYPAPEDFEQIQNRQAIRNLEDDGDVLTTPRTVDHYANFRTPQDGQAFALAAQPLGFEFAEQTSDEGDTEFPISVHLTRVHPVDEETVDEVTYQLYELAENHNGQYDGWESPVVK